ncbi:glutamate ABC transporter substrate-binding protein [Actinomadura parmotrematis]|uniref:Glutamate ABC transporter substrate-binding protein n=1 Tax=Actinomadura parmotrematis TaxID=2864039 RepID=A0ABS7FT50_9ACTN|nr:glutamate ABC transporter substrate-binding protein [Actinomadura parmotrematis]MBW8483584.1 glutamate ABC transporter substrate-binding protein [Actinomadura parmotrematis]
MRVRTFGVALAGLAAASLAASGCSAKKDDTVDGKKELVVGVKADQPGMGLNTPQGFQGIDIDVANYIAKKLGATKVTFKEAKSANRESFLANGTVDMVVATYSITAERLPKVTFGGPWVVTHQDILVRANDNSITKVQDLKGKKVCQVQGSNSWKRITEDNKVDAKLVPAQGYEDCIVKLKAGTLDAVSTDATILAGYAQREGSSVKLANAPFTDEKYGVGLKKGDTKGCEAVNKAITDMYKDGTAKTLWDKWFGKTNLKFDATQPPAQGCS